MNIKKYKHNKGCQKGHTTQIYKIFNFQKSLKLFIFNQIYIKKEIS